MRKASLDAKLDWLASTGDRTLSRGLRGFEKECLRVRPDGRLAETRHPGRLGSALTHPYLTTDYSEALLEFVTPPFRQLESAVSFLEELHGFVTQNLGDELLWPASMPCIVGSDEAVPIAQYGNSNEGRLRSIYRSGLGFRYGRAMQAIAGAHFNFSLPEEFWPEYREFLGDESDIVAFRSECLMGLVRNFRRIGWLITYLFGASPAFCKSFRPDGHARLESMSRDTWYAPYATSLRMSDMGYRNSTQARLSISVNSLEDYIRELTTALTTKEPQYASIGIKVNGEYRQLNDCVLQLENEYYSSIRPKPVSKTPRLVTALAETGVEYVEVRTLDLNPFDPLGVTAEQARFVEVLLSYCLLSDSAPISESEQGEIDRRELDVAWSGRKPGLEIVRAGRQTTLSSWALELIDRFGAVAGLMDDADGLYSEAVNQAREAIADPACTFSARVLDGIDSASRSFFEWSFGLATKQRQHFLDYSFEPGRREALEALAEDSLHEARALESAAEPPFDEFLAACLARGIS